MSRILFCVTALASLIFVGAVSMAGGEDGEFIPYVDATGGITLPDPATVRARWNHLGTWAIQGEDGVKEFHAVYTQPGTIEAYRETGEFPDGAVLVKELRKASGGALTTGEVAWGGDAILWFVMIKDRKDRFAGNPLWAKGWGWALFLAENRARNAATNFRADCMACHEPAEGTHWVYTQGYPVLRD
jgi:hypothetical protein